MKKAKFIIYILILCLSTLILAVSCDYADPLPGLSNRVGTYENTDDNFTVVVSDDAKTIEIEFPSNDEDAEDGDTTTESITTLGANDMRLDFYATSDVRVVFAGNDFNTCYLYTNAYSDSDAYSTCTR